MKALVSLLVISGWAASQNGSVLDHMPADTRIVINFNAQAISKSAIVKQYGERLKSIFDAPALLGSLGVDPNQVERIWFFLGEEYPRGSSIVISGKIEPAKIEAKMQQWIRERKLAVRPFREDNRPMYSLEIPTGFNPIPGVPSTISLAASDDRLILASDQRTLLWWVRNSAGSIERFASLKSELTRDSALVSAFVPPNTLSAKDALLSGITKLTFDIELTENLIARLVLHGTENAAIESRARAGLDQARQVFAPLAVQQGIEARAVNSIVELLNNAKVEARADSVEISSTLDKPAIDRLLKR